MAFSGRAGGRHRRKPKGFRKDASHHAREHKTPTEGTANGIHRPAPKNQQLRYSGFLTLPLKVCCLSAKKFSDRPLFQKGSPGAGREPCTDRQKRGNAGTHRPAPIDRRLKINGSGIPGSLPFHEKYVAIRKKVFGSTPFSKGVAGLQGGALRKVPKQGWRSVSIDWFPKIYGSGIPDSSPLH